jgi:hypothetical protein
MYSICDDSGLLKHVNNRLIKTKQTIKLNLRCGVGYMYMELYIWTINVSRQSGDGINNNRIYQISVHVTWKSRFILFLSVVYTGVMRSLQNQVRDPY